MGLAQFCFVFVLFGLCHCVLGYVRFRYRDCTNSENRILRVEDARLPEEHLTIPGHIHPYVNVRILRPADGDYQLNVTVEKSVFGYFFPLPCIGNVGSCTYDLCQLLDYFGNGRCPWQLALSNFPCTCPVSEGRYVLSPRPFYIPRVHGVWAWLATGDYHVKGVLTDMATSEEIGCYEVFFSVQDDCQDYWCMFG